MSSRRSLAYASEERERGTTVLHAFHDLNEIEPRAVHVEVYGDGPRPGHVHVTVSHVTWIAFMRDALTNERRAHPMLVGTLKPDGTYDVHALEETQRRAPYHTEARMLARGGRWYAIPIVEGDSAQVIGDRLLRALEPSAGPVATGQIAEEPTPVISQPLNLEAIRSAAEVGISRHARIIDIQRSARALPHVLAVVDVQTRALLAVEWGRSDACEVCGRDQPTGVHLSGCVVDAALDAAGLDTQEKRDAARESTRAER